MALMPPWPNRLCSGSSTSCLYDGGFHLGLLVSILVERMLLRRPAVKNRRTSLDTKVYGQRFPVDVPSYGHVVVRAMVLASALSCQTA